MVGSCPNTPTPPCSPLTDAEGAAVRVRLVDFAHSFRTNSSARDDNFLLGLTSLMQRMRRVQGEDLDIAFV